MWLQSIVFPFLSSIIPGEVEKFLELNRSALISVLFDKECGKANETKIPVGKPEC